MKKALSFAVALGLVAGMASVASAEDMLSIHGDARWRGVYMQNADDATDHFDGTGTPAAQGQDTRQVMDQRYRLNADLNLNEDVKINTRIVLADNEFGNENSLNHYVDRANMSIKTLGGTWTIGKQDASWGNKFLAWGVSVDRFKGTYKTGDLTYGGYLQKNKEGDDRFGDGDNDIWGAFLVGKAGDTSWGVLLNYNVFDEATTFDANGNVDTEKGDTGFLIDPFFTTKVGPATILGELVYKDGDSLDNSDGDPIYGGFVSAAMDLAPVTVKGLVAYYANNEGDPSVGGAGRDCDNDFAPTLLIGTCNETAILDFGGTTGWTTDTTLTASENLAMRKSQADDTTYLVAAGVDFKANDKLTLGAAAAYLMLSEYGGVNMDEDATLVEVDLTAQYQLAQNATYTIGAAYGMPDAVSAKDDDIFVVGNRIEVKW